MAAHNFKVRLSNSPVIFLPNNQIIDHYDSNDGE